jgi:hypothetical protein
MSHVRPQPQSQMCDNSSTGAEEHLLRGQAETDLSGGSRLRLGAS